MRAPIAGSHMLVSRYTPTLMRTPTAVDGIAARSTHSREARPAWTIELWMDESVLSAVLSMMMPTSHLQRGDRRRDAPGDEPRGRRNDEHLGPLLQLLLLQVLIKDDEVRGGRGVPELLDHAERF